MNARPAPGRSPPPPRRRAAAAIACGLLLAFAGGCGLEDYYYLYPVSRDNDITVSSYDRASVKLPSGYPNYFVHFRIYYRIYITDVLDLSPSSASADALNTTLASDYASFLTYIGSDTKVNTNMDTVFNGRGFYALEVEGADLEQGPLGQNSPGKTITFDFQEAGDAAPRMFVDDGSATGAPYTLYRSTGDGAFSPQPDRLFVNTEDLTAEANLIATVNKDVVNKTGIYGTKYTYAAFYIIAMGIDPNFSPIYSTPAFIGILKLPDSL